MYKRFLFYFFTLIFFETIFKMVYGFNLNYLFILCVSLFYSSLLVLLNSLVKRKNLLGIIILTVLSIFYSAHIVYYNTYNTILSIYSISKTGEVMEFKGAAFEMIFKNIFYITVIFIPLVIFIIFKKHLTYPKNLKPFILFLLLSVFFIIPFMFINRDSNYSYYKLIFKENTSLYTADKLGIITTMKLDFIKNVTDFKESEIKIDEKKKEVE